MSSYTQKAIPEKIQLNGADCFHLVITKFSEKYQAGNNVMRMVLYLDKTFSPDKFTEKVCNDIFLKIVNSFKLKTGLPGQIPYWKVSQNLPKISVGKHYANVEKEIPQEIFQKNILPDGTEKIQFEIISYPSGKFALVIAWNHILMDVRGVLNLLHYLDNENNNTEITSLFPLKKKEISLSNQLKSMMKIKNFIEKSAKAPIISVADRNNQLKVNHFKPFTLEFTEAETAAIEKNAFANGAKFGANMFHLACCVMALKELLKNRGKEGVMWLPLTYDGRLKGISPAIISNHVSYLFYRIETKDQGEIKSLIKSLNHQMMSQIKEEISVHYNNLLSLMSRFPIWLYSMMVNKTGEGTMSSFLFSSTGNYINEFKNFMGAGVETIDIFPTATFPPGLTFSFLMHKNQLKINIIYSEGCISQVEFENLATSIRTLLLKITHKLEKN
jgi:hypothetical protein